jgi:GH25 family lysozyme M1 (1,4-beta-N-acetylmuramidase)
MKQLAKIIYSFALIFTLFIGTGINTFADESFHEGVAGDGNAVDTVETPASKIVIRGNNITLNIGDTAHINYSLYPKNSDDYVVMKSLFTNVATVTQDGEVTAVGPGTGIIQLRTGSGKKAKMTVNVRNPADSGDLAPTGIRLDRSYAKLRENESSQIEARMYPLGTSAEFTYSSANSAVAAVDKNGRVTAKSVGETYITVSNDDFRARFNVSVYRNVYKGIDVSRWQGDIDWKAVKDDGITFAMIRAGYGKATPDNMLAANVEGCEENIIPYGFYHYTYAKNTDEARIEANYFVSRIKDYSPRLPVVLDIEESFYNKMSNKEIAAIIDTFMEVMKANGYNTAVYSNAYFFTNNTDIDNICSNYPVWIASWGDKEKLNAFYDGDYYMWQYSEVGKVNGINGNVDLNYYYL